MPSRAKVAVVIPCYNEEAGLPHLTDALIVQREKLKDRCTLDIIFVNDGSSDASQQVIETLAKQNNFIFYRAFAQNAGHQSALRAGLDVCGDYDAVIMMDADMQHPPELLPKMIEAWRQGNSIVQMVRSDTADQAGFIKYVTSKLYYKILNSLSSLNMKYGSSDFRLIDNGVLSTLLASTEKNLFLRGYFSWLPTTRTTIEYTPGERYAGTSKYTFKKMLDLASKGVMQFSEKPLQIATSIGVFMALASFLYGLFLIIGHFIGSNAVSGWTSLMVVLLFCFGLNFILLGIIGRYLAHAIQLVKARPEYLIAAEKLRKK